METRLSGCHWKSTRRSFRVFFFTLLLLLYISPPAELRSTDVDVSDRQTHSTPLEPIWRMPCGLCEASHSCSIISCPSLMWVTAKTTSPSKNCCADFHVLMVAAFEVFHLKQRATDDLVSAVPQGRMKKGSRHLPLGVLLLLLPGKDRGGSPQPSQDVITAGWLLSPCCSPAPTTPPTSIPVAVDLSLKHTHTHPTAAREPPWQQIFTLLLWFIPG